MVRFWLEGLVFGFKGRQKSVTLFLKVGVRFGEAVLIIVEGERECNKINKMYCFQNNKK